MVKKKFYDGPLHVQALVMNGKGEFSTRPELHAAWTSLLKVHFMMTIENTVRHFTQISLELKNYFINLSVYATSSLHHTQFGQREMHFLCTHFSQGFL